jgi:hypothetical protein
MLAARGNDVKKRRPGVVGDRSQLSANALAVISQSVAPGCTAPRITESRLFLLAGMVRICPWAPYRRQPLLVRESVFLSREGFEPA